LEKLIQYNMLDKDFKSESNPQIPLNGKYLLNLGNTSEVLSRNASSSVITISLFDKQDGGEMVLPFVAEDTRQDFYNLELRKDWRGFNFDNLKNEFYYLNAERLGPRLSYDVEQQEFENVGCQGEYSIQVLAQNKENKIVNFEARGYQGIADSKLISQVRAWMNYIIPGFYIDIAELEGKLKKAYTTYSNSSPTNVGFGISYVLPIVVSGLIAKEDSMFIVENPEAHLHPKGQSNIGYFLGQLANSGLQIIIETHSEHVINGIRRATLENKNNTDDVLLNFFSGIDSDKNSTVKEIFISKSGDLTNFPKDFFDQVQQDMYSLFNMQKINNG
jgi:predicted ATPase